MRRDESARGRYSAAGWDLMILVAVLGLPLLGARLTGRELRAFFAFPPPLVIPRDYVPFSWVAAAAVAAVLLLLTAAWVHAWRRETHAASIDASRAGPWPWWGWVGGGWTLVWWMLAWTRAPWFASLQAYTFFPLWLGFIVTVNAATYRRTQTCLLTRAPRRWLLLFLVSAVFWWVFEWLNRFVQNWHYLGVEGASRLEYAVHASICFSTVLPAVAAVAEWIGAHARWRSLTGNGPAWRALESPSAAVWLALGGLAALACTGASPRWAYPALWVAPLTLFLGRASARRATVIRELATGDWRRVATWMAASLGCGFFWELWNWHSLAKWIYTVPGVERWFVFEMPLLGYAGYLPFGLECLLVVERMNELLDRRARVPV